MNSSENFMDNIYLSYDKILNKLKALNIRTRTGNIVNENDLRTAIRIMLKKHPSCRWQNQKVKGKKKYILYEGFLWIMYVYFQNEKKQIDADIIFFENRIMEYEKTLHINSKNLFIDNIFIGDLQKYFNRSEITIKRAIAKMKKITSNDYKIFENRKCIITSEGIEWLSKNLFKQKYLEILEQYKMELTEKYIQAGYIYD